jgi:hypothetical protein
VAEDENTSVLTAELGHGLEQHHAAGDVVVVVAQRLRHRFADRLQAGEVDHGVDLVRAERGFDRRAVADVGLDELESLSRDASHPLLHGTVGVGQVVDHDHVMARVLQLDHGVRTDVTHTASNQNLHCVAFVNSLPVAMPVLCPAGAIVLFVRRLLRPP